MALEPQHVRAIALRLAGNTFREMAKILEVDDATVCRWLQREDVREALEQAQQDAAQAGRSLLRASYSAAAKKLMKLVDSDDESIAIRASVEVLDRVPLPPEEHALVEVPASTGDPWTASTK